MFCVFLTALTTLAKLFNIYIFRFCFKYEGRLLLLRSLYGAVYMIPRDGIKQARVI